jgi:hypothetical protein
MADSFPVGRESIPCCGRIDSLFPRAGNLWLGISQTSEFMDLFERVVTASGRFSRKFAVVSLLTGGMIEASFAFCGEA